MRLRIATVVAVSAALVTLAMFSFTLAPTAIHAPSTRPDSARTAGTLAVRTDVNLGTPNVGTHYGSAASPAAATNTDNVLYRPSPGTCLGMLLGGFWMTGLAYGLAFGPEGAAVVGAGLLAYAVYRAAVC